MNDIIKQVESAYVRVIEEVAQMPDAYENLRRFYDAITPSHLGLSTYDEAVKQRASELGPEADHL